MARFIFRCIKFTHTFLTNIGKKDTANMIMMSVYHMPFRGIARLTGGIINTPMVDGIIMMVNGHFFKGLNHFLKERNKFEKVKKLNAQKISLKQIKSTSEVVEEA